MKTSNTQIFTFTKEEIEDILVNYIHKHAGTSGGVVKWNIAEGDTGIKDPMDYSEYSPTRVSTVSVTVGDK